MTIKSNFPEIRPSLNLDFANTRALDPRITFTRTTTATYYDGKTTAKAEENLLLQSETLNTTWTATNASVTANTEVAPDGTTTAETITDTAVDLGHFINQTITTNLSTDYVLSVFLKAGTSDYAGISLTNPSVANRFATVIVDLDAGTVGDTETSNATIVSSSITSFGNGWYRVVMVANATTTAFTAARICLSDSATPAVYTNVGQPQYLGTGTTIYAWGAQLEQRSAVTDYTPTTTQPITNYIPVLLTAASGVARFDHNPTTGESLGLLVEEQRTNLCLRSEEFDNVSWSKGNSSVTGNVVVAPDGTLTGDIVVANTVSGEHNVDSGLISITSGTTYTFTCYVKFAGLNEVGLRYTVGSNWPGSNSPQIKFTFSTGITSVIAGTITAHGATAVGNGWYRVFMTVAAAATGNSSARIQLMSPGNSFVGDDYSGVYAWGAQVEAGAFPTSYIATTSASVTRNADVASMTGTNFSSWYRADEGTLYGEFIQSNQNTTFRGIARLADSTGTNSIGILIASNSLSVRGITNLNSVAQASLVLGNTTAGQASKAILVYKTDDFAGVLNGGSVLTDTSGILPVVDRLSIGEFSGGALNGYVKKVSYYPLRLTNEQLQALTAS